MKTNITKKIVNTVMQSFEDIAVYEFKSIQNLKMIFKDEQHFINKLSYELVKEYYQIVEQYNMYYNKRMEEFGEYILNNIKKIKDI